MEQTNRGKRAKKKKKEVHLRRNSLARPSSRSVPFLRSLTPPFPSISHKYVLRCHSFPLPLSSSPVFFHPLPSQYIPTSLLHSTHSHSLTFSTTCLPTRSTVCRYHRDRLFKHIAGCGSQRLIYSQFSNIHFLPALAYQQEEPSSRCR